VRAAPLSPGKGAWLAGWLLAVLAHAALAAAVFWTPASPPQGQAVAAGTGGVEIALGPAGRAAGGPQTREAEEASSKEEVEPEPEPQPEPEPEPEPEPVPEPEPEPEPEPDSEPDSEPERVPEAPREPATPPRASVAGAAGQSGTREADNTGSGDNTAGGGLPGETRDYAATLLAWLERHKEYPRQARVRRQQGTVLLYFVVDRSGRVLAHRIEQSSGYPALDEEVLAMIERAQPLPAMPETMDEQTLELVVPVQFFIRR